MTKQPQRMNGKGPDSDLCFTPSYALLPILELMPDHWKTIWEPAAGGGDMVKVFEAEGYNVISGDIEEDFFKYTPPDYDVQITNPPFSKLEAWLNKSFLTNKPWALLLKHNIDSNQYAQIPFVRYGGVHKIVLNQRVDFKTVNTTFEESSGWFDVAWYLWPRDKWLLPETFITTSLATLDKQWQPGQLRMF